jgi:PadR family transcriptional regulator, regulatory protein PadR
VRFYFGDRILTSLPPNLLTAYHLAPDGLTWPFCSATRAASRQTSRGAPSNSAGSSTRQRRPEGRVALCATIHVEAEGEAVDLPQGTLDLLILKAIALEPHHGWAISERIQQISNNALRVNQGSLYPALHRLERKGWIKAEWDVSENNRRAKYYELTAKGRRRLAEQTDAWRALTAAIGLLLDHR